MLTVTHVRKWFEISQRIICIDIDEYEKLIFSDEYKYFLIRFDGIFEFGEALGKGLKK